MVLECLAESCPLEGTVPKTLARELRLLIRLQLNHIGQALGKTVVLMVPELMESPLSWESQLHI